MFDIPILLLAFNRPNLTSQVFKRIKKVQPKELFIALDGPRLNNHEDEEALNDVKIIIRDINWKCDVHYLERHSNLGCGKSVSEAITWFFDHVEMGIILEDDCLPEYSFFKYCQELLQRYKYDKNIYQINGVNWLIDYKNAYDYYFSKYPAIWGWATWKDRWNKYNLDINIDDQEIINSIKDHLSSSKDFAYHYTTFMNAKNIDTWDYSWKFTIFKAKGICITPVKNMIKNIGFGQNATHTTNEFSWQANLISHQIEFPLKHPKSISLDNRIDKLIAKKLHFISNNSITDRIKKILLNVKGN